MRFPTALLFLATLSSYVAATSTTPSSPTSTSQISGQTPINTLDPAPTDLNNVKETVIWIYLSITFAREMSERVGALALEVLVGVERLRNQIQNQSEVMQPEEARRAITQLSRWEARVLGTRDETQSDYSRALDAIQDADYYVQQIRELMSAGYNPRVQVVLIANTARIVAECAARAERSLARMIKVARQVLPGFDQGQWLHYDIAGQLAEARAWAHTTHGF